jgi:hypothetical protein
MSSNGIIFMPNSVKIDTGSKVECARAHTHTHRQSMVIS